MKSKRALLAACGGATLIVASTLLPSWNPVDADGTEELGTPSIAIESGSGVVVGGVGLELAQPGIINVDVPAGTTVKQVLLYWEGQNRTPTGDDTIIVGGTTVTGVLIGGPTFFFRSQRTDFYTSTYRADITSLGLVSAGPNAVAVSGLDFDQVSDGAGLTVIYDDGTDAEIGLFDGSDIAFINFPAPLHTTVAKTFSFTPATTSRTGDLSMHFSSVTGPRRPGERPSIIEVTIDGTTTQFTNLLTSSDGDEWDSLMLSVDIPAGATEATVQALSDNARGDGQNPLAASFVWNAATFAVPIPPPPPTTLNVPTIPTTVQPTTTTTQPTATLPATTSTPPTTNNAPGVTTTTTTVVQIGQTTVPPDVTTTVVPTGILPETGSTNSRLPLGTGLIALAGGLALVALARRRPNTSA